MLYILLFIQGEVSGFMVTKEMDARNCPFLSFPLLFLEPGDIYRRIKLCTGLVIKNLLICSYTHSVFICAHLLFPAQQYFIDVSWAHKPSHFPHV